MGSTQMIRFECQQCEMSATMVDTEAARRAWRDHMLTHDRFLSFRSWAWEVVELPLGEYVPGRGFPASTPLGVELIVDPPVAD